MKHYKNPADNSVWAFEEDGSQDNFVTPDMVQLSAAQLAVLRTPPPPPVPSVISMRQARLALLAAGKLAAVNGAIAALPATQQEAAQIEWEYAAVVQRDNPLIAALAAAVGMDAPALDALFTTASAL